MSTTTPSGVSTGLSTGPSTGQILAKKSNWTLLIYALLIAVVGLVAYKIFDVLVNNPVTKAVNKAVGAIGLLLSDFTKGCCKQSDCSFTGKDDCKSGCGCGWDTKSSVCTKTTGAETGSGGPLTTSCPLFIFSLIGGIAFALVNIVSLIRGNRSKSKAVEDLAQTGDSGTTEEIVESLRENIETNFEKARELTENKGVELSKADLDYLANTITEKTILKDVIDPLKTKDADLAAERIAENVSQAKTSAEAYAIEGGEQGEAIEDAAEEATEEIPEPEGHVE